VFITNAVLLPHSAIDKLNGGKLLVSTQNT